MVEISSREIWGERIEIAEGFQFVAKKVQAHRPGAGRRENIHNAAAQGDFALLGHLRLRLIALRLQKFNQIERGKAIAPFQSARARLQGSGCKRFLEQG